MIDPPLPPYTMPLDGMGVNCIYKENGIANNDELETYYIHSHEPKK